MEKILVGSASFFKGMEGYKGTENYIVILDEPKKGCSKWWSKRGDDTFEWVKHEKDEQLKKLMATGVEQRVAALLSPELAEVFGVTAEDIKKFSHLWDKCEGKNAYYKVIANAYIENGYLGLTDEQKSAAYDEYKKARE